MLFSFFCVCVCVFFKTKNKTLAQWWNAHHGLVADANVRMKWHLVLVYEIIMLYFSGL